MRVLLVEDEPRLAETVRRGLAAEGFVVDVEHDGVDAKVSQWLVYADGVREYIETARLAQAGQPQASR